MKDKLKIYTPEINLNFVVEENLLYLGKVNNSVISQNKTFRKLKSEDINSEVEYTSLSECDFIYFPEKIRKQTNLSNLINLSKSHNKKILLFYNDDNDEVFNFENSIIFRTSLHKSKKPKNYFSVPAFCNDLKEECAYYTREKNITPTIGFCGAITHNLREQVISKLKTSKNVISNFKIRNNFWGGNVWGEIVRKEYIENTLDSDFVICVRGAGNFSYRLYETLCLGRIPLVIDTDIDLPFESYINYDSLILKVPVKDLNKIDDYVLDFWSKISDYQDLQKKIIGFWESHLSPIGFIRTLNENKNEINNLLY